jgi:hypothetical protein
MSLVRGVLSLCIVITGEATAAIGFADELPLCVRPIDPSSFTSKGTKVVTGDPNARLYLHPQHPAGCAGNPGTSCQATIYIVTGDRVSTGDTCRDWTAMEYHGKKRDFYGWVQSNRLAEVTNTGVMKDALVPSSLDENRTAAHKAPITRLTDGSADAQGSANMSVKRSELSFDGVG